MDLLPKEIIAVTTVTSLLIITIFLMIVASAIVMLVLIYQKKQLQYISDKEQLKVTFQNEILETQLEIQEQTFKNVSQEIHDNIGQVLSLVKLNINTMDCDSQIELREKIGDSKILISKAIQDLRDLSRSLNTDFIMKTGLVRSVEYELELISRTGSNKTQFRLTGQPYRLEAQQELILFRMVQEALHNIIKHASAKEIIVQVDFTPNNFTLLIKDDGVGIVATLLEESGNVSNGLGIKNMYNRAKIIAAHLKIDSVPKKGTSITIALAINKPKL